MIADGPVSAVIPVSDLARAKRFYTEVLGMTVVDEAEAGTEFGSGGGTRLFAYETPSAGQAEHTLASWNVADLDAEMAELRSRGVTFEEYDLPGITTENGVATAGNIRGAWFKDPDGNILSLGQHV